MTVLRLYEPTSGRIIVGDEDTTSFYAFSKPESILSKLASRSFLTLKRSFSGSVEGAISSIEDGFDKKWRRSTSKNSTRTLGNSSESLRGTERKKRKAFRRDAC